MYKSTRLLVEAVHKEMEALRKLLMSTTPGDVTDDGQSAIETLNIIRSLFGELAAKADRPTIEDVVKLSPVDYVATMKPLVGNFHRQLMVADRLAPCLCEDLQAAACVLILIGDDKTIVRTAHDPNRPEIQLAVETLIESIDTTFNQVVKEGVAAAEKQLGIEVPENPELESIDEGVRFGGSPDDGEQP